LTANHDFSGVIRTPGFPADQHLPASVCMQTDRQLRCKRSRLRGAPKVEPERPRVVSTLCSDIHTWTAATDAYLGTSGRVRLAHPVRRPSPRQLPLVSGPRSEDEPPCCCAAPHGLARKVGRPIAIQDVSPRRGHALKGRSLRRLIDETPLSLSTHCLDGSGCGRIRHEFGCAAGPHTHIHTHIHTQTCCTSSALHINLHDRKNLHGTNNI